MKVKRIEHVAIAVKSLAKARSIFEDKLGLTFEYEEYLPQYHTKLAMFPVGSTYIELLESEGADTETTKWISEHGEGLSTSAWRWRTSKRPWPNWARGSSFSTKRPASGTPIRASPSSIPKSTNDVLIELVELGEGHGPAPGARAQG